MFLLSKGSCLKVRLKGREKINVEPEIEKRKYQQQIKFLKKSKLTSSFLFDVEIFY